MASTSAPNAEVVEFLTAIKVPQHAATLCELGYDDVDDYKNLNVGTLREYLITALR